jgi:hypothetical protein
VTGHPSVIGPRVGLVSVLVLSAGLGLAGCGKKGPNQPPLRILPSPAQDLRVRQVGSEIRVSARIPMLRTDGAPLGDKTQVRVLRMRATVTLRPGAVSAGYLARQFEKGAQAIATFTGAEIRAATTGGRLRFADTTAPAPAPGAARAGFLYSIVVLDGEGKRSVLPPPILIEPSAPLPVPHDLRVEHVEGEIRISWKAGEGAIPRETPAPGASNGVGAPPAAGAAPGSTASSGGAPGPTAATGAAPARLYNLYRATQAETEMPDEPLNRDPIETSDYVDREFAYGESYRYVVRALGGRQKPQRESADSVVVEVRPLDVFPPHAPSGVAVAVEGSVIRVYWFPNAEPDLAGYRIERRESPTGEFRRLGEVGPAETSFADATAKPGVRYYYTVIAFDSAVPPNESVRSEERSETRPAEGEAPSPPGAAPAGTPAAGPSPASGRGR